MMAGASACLSRAVCEEGTVGLRPPRRAKYTCVWVAGWRQLAGALRTIGASALRSVAPRCRCLRARCGWKLLAAATCARKARRGDACCVPVVPSTHAMGGWLAAASERPADERSIRSAWCDAAAPVLACMLWWVLPAAAMWRSRYGGVTLAAARRTEDTNVRVAGQQLLSGPGGRRARRSASVLARCWRRCSHACSLDSNGQRAR